MENMRKIKLIFWIFVLFLMFNLAYAQPPGQVLGNMNILYPKFDSIAYGTNFTFHLHAFDELGVLLNNTLYDCRIHIYEPNGSHIIEDFMSNDTNYVDKEFIFDEAVHTDLGWHSYNIWCYSSNEAGAISNSFLVSATGEDFTTSSSIIYFGLFIVFTIFFVICLFFAISIDGENKFTMGEKGEPLVELNSGKYIKLFLYLLSYLFFWILSWGIWQVSTKFLLATQLFGVLRILFIIETILWIPIIIIVLVIGLVKHFTDINIEKETKRGLFPRK